MAAIQAFFALGTFVGPVVGGAIVTVGFPPLRYRCPIPPMTNFSFPAYHLEMGFLH